MNAAVSKRENLPKNSSMTIRSRSSFNFIALIFAQDECVNIAVTYAMLEP